MAKGKVILILCIALVVVGLVGVNAEFSYQEDYHSPVNNYDNWYYKIHVGDENTKIIVNHQWSSPSYDSEYYTSSNFPFDVTPPTPRILVNPVSINQPSIGSYNIGSSLANLLGRNSYSPYGYYRNSFLGYGGYNSYYSYTPNYWW